MLVKINGSVYETQKLANGREMLTFTATDPNMAVTLLKAGGCIGDYHIDDVQIEKGEFATSYEPPRTYQSDLSGIFKDLHRLNLEINDPESGLKSQILLTEKGWYQKLEDAKAGMKAEMGSTADKIMQNVTNTLNGNYSSFEQRLEGLRASVHTSATESAVSQLSDLYDVKIKNLETNVESRLSVTDGKLQSYITDNNGKYSKVQQLVDGLQVSIADTNKELETKFTFLTDLMDIRISKDYLSSIIRQSGDAIWLAVKGGVKDNGVTKPLGQLLINENGVQISGSKVHITGDTLIDSASIASSKIQSLSADKITVGTLNASKVRIINLDVNNLVGLDARLQTVHSSVLQSLNTGAMRWNLDTNKLDMYSSSLIEFHSNENFLYRRAHGQRAFLNFTDDYRDGTHLLMHLGISRRDSFVAWDKYFTGMRIYPDQEHISFITRTFSIFSADTDTAGLTIWTGADSTGSTVIAPGKGINVFGQKATNWSTLWAQQVITTNYGLVLEATNEIMCKSTGNGNIAKFGNNGNDMWRNLNMHGKNINLNWGQLQNNSDARLKHDIQPSTYDALSRIDQIDFKTFKWNKTNEKAFGFIAQEMQKYAPEWITEDNDGYLGYSASKLIVAQARAIQQLNQKVKELENEIKNG